VVRVDPSFERISRRLTSLELRERTPDEDELVDLRPGDARGRTHADFLHTYSVAGIRRVITEYGLEAKLAAQGLSDVEVSIEHEDAFRHRLLIHLRDPAAKVREVMDLRVHLCTLGLPGDPTPFEIAAVEWLLMQNPRRSFTRERPRLPGQRFPGTGLGRDVGQLLVLLCKRIGRAGLVTVPEHFHLAELYARGGYAAVAEDDEHALFDLTEATAALTLGQRAWAIERGCVFDEDDEPVPYVPHARVLAVSSELSAALSPFGRFFRAATRPRRRLAVDVERLRRTLREDPVEGMDPADIPG
jgi:hypothetical protein